MKIGTVKPSDTQARQIAVETDTALAATYEKLAKLRQRQGFAYDSLHRALGDSQDRRGNWGMSNLDAYRTADRMGRLAAMATSQIKQALDRLVEIERDIDFANERINELDVIWALNGCWNRYYLVTNSNGHVHRETSCRTCFRDTEYAWLIDLADCDEAAMIEEFGEKACTVCFPDAPANPHFNGPGRRDREALAARQAEKDARNDAKAAKRLAEHEVFRTSYNRDRVETVAACKDIIRKAIDTAEELKVITTPEFAKGYSDPEFLTRLISNVTDHLGQQQRDAQEATLVLLRREARHEGWGMTQAAIDKMIASKRKASAKAWARA